MASTPEGLQSEPTPKIRRTDGKEEEEEGKEANCLLLLLLVLLLPLVTVIAVRRHGCRRFGLQGLGFGVQAFP